LLVNPNRKIVNELLMTAYQATKVPKIRIVQLNCHSFFATIGQECSH